MDPQDILKEQRHIFQVKPDILLFFKGESLKKNFNILSQLYQYDVIKFNGTLYQIKNHLQPHSVKGHSVEKIGLNFDTFFPADGFLSQVQSIIPTFFMKEPQNSQDFFSFSYTTMNNGQTDKNQTISYIQKTFYIGDDNLMQDYAFPSNNSEKGLTIIQKQNSKKRIKKQQTETKKEQERKMPKVYQIQMDQNLINQKSVKFFFARK